VFAFLKTLLSDLIEQREALQVQCLAIRKKWDKYLFVDEFICDLLVEKKCKLQLEILRIEKAIQQCKKAV
jgi:hypothetical protein